MFACKANDIEELHKQITFVFGERQTRSAGLAWYATKRISFSSPLWERMTEEEKKQIAIHETCHIISYEKYGNEGKGHGQQWQQCMKKAQVRPLRCHTIDRTGLRTRQIKYAVTCACTTAWVSRYRAEQCKESLLTCKRCKTKVTLTGETVKPPRY